VGEPERVNVHDFPNRQLGKAIPYARDPQTGGFYTVGLMVLALSGTQICAMTRFDSSILPRFGLPASLSN
jgi:hypothetical protein